MNGEQLKGYGAVRELAAMQRELGVPDGNFARSIRLGYSGSSWGKMKAGTFSGNHEKASKACGRALARAAGSGAVEVVDGVVMFDQVAEAIDAVEVARRARDEHRLVVVCGESGAGKSVIGRLLAEKFEGTYIHAHPSWSRSYMRCLVELAAGLGVSAVFRGSGDAERGVLDALASSPRLVVIDEANHFSRDAINFLKTLLNETKCALVLCTLPGHLARLSAVHAEESRQLLRRAVAIVHIPRVSSAEVLAIHTGLYPSVLLDGQGPALASASNRLHRIDTVRRVFEEAALGGEELGEAIARVERMMRTAVRD